MSSFLHFIIAFTSLPLSLFVRLRSYGFLEHRCDVLKAYLYHILRIEMKAIFILAHFTEFEYWLCETGHFGVQSTWSTGLSFILFTQNIMIAYTLAILIFFLKKEHYHPLLLLSTEVRTNTDFFHKGCNRTSGSYLLNFIWKYFKSCFELAAGTSSLTHLYLHSSHLYIWHTLRTLHWHNVEMGFNATWRSTERVSSTC